MNLKTEKEDISFKVIDQGLGFHQFPTSSPSETPTISINKDEFKGFYKSPSSKKEEKKENTDMPLTPTAAPWWSLLMAWIVDIATILLYLSVIIVLFSFVEKINIINMEILIYLGILFLLIYFMYFIFFDKTQHGTLGKYLFKLKIVDNYGNNADISTLLFRSLIVVFSFFTFGTFLLMNLHGRLSGTKIVKKSLS